MANGSTNPYAAAGAASGPGAGNGAAGGWQGLGGLLSFLQGNINSQQQGNMVNGAQGNGFGAIGGAHGAASGLSPWAMSYLAQHLLTANPAAQQALTDAQGNPLTGAALQMATLQNQLAQGASPTYSMGKDVTTDMLGQLLQTFQKDTGHQAYVNGYNATGRVAAGGGGGNGQGGQGGSGGTVPNRTLYEHGPGGRTIYGQGLHGGDFFSQAAATAAHRLGQYVRPKGR